MKTIAVISPEKNVYSTTFIKAHIERLKANVKHLHGVFFPTHAGDKSLKKWAHKYTFRERMVIRLTGKAKPRTLQQTLEEGFTEYLRINNVELVLAEFGPVGVEVLATCQKLRIPMIVHFFGYDAYMYSVLKKYGEPYKSVFAYASFMVVVSTDMQQQLISLGAPPEKVVLTYCGPNEKCYDVQPTFAQTRFLAAGRFVDKKAPYFTLMAFRKVLEQVPDAQLVMVGDGALVNTCKNLARYWGIDHAVQFAGALSHDELIDEYRQSLAFVQHSIVPDNGDSEGTPVAVLEASAAALPVVSTQHGGIKDVVKHGVTGFLAPERDVEGMAEYMIQLAQDVPRARRMGEEGRKFVQENFTMEKHIAILQGLVDKTTPQQPIHGSNYSAVNS